VQQTDADFYGSATQYQKIIWQLKNLEETTHTIRVEWAGAKNSASTGYRINLDALDVGGILIAGAPDHVTRYEQSYPDLYYRGSWSTTTAATYSGSSLASTVQSGAAVYSNPAGTQIDVIASTGPDKGIMKVSLESTPPLYVDLYSAAATDQAKVLSIKGLEDTTHTLVISSTGSKGTTSTGTGITLDAVDVAGWPVPDTWEPHTTADDTSSAWRPANAVVTLSATDVGSFVAATRYKIGSGSTMPYLVPFTVSAEGTTDVVYSSTDGAGNNETSHTATYKIDKSAPGTSDDARVRGCTLRCACT